MATKKRRTVRDDLEYQRTATSRDHGEDEYEFVVPPAPMLLDEAWRLVLLAVGGRPFG
jgi:hypothetical protein